LPDSGIAPARLPENSTAVYYLYPFRYDAQPIRRTAPRQVHPRAGAKDFPVVPATASSITTAHRRGDQLDRLQAPLERRTAEGVSGELQRAERHQTSLRNGRLLLHSLLMADRSAMDHILEAIRKIQAHSAELAKKA